MSIWYRWKKLAARGSGRGVFLVGCRVLSSEGRDTKKGRKMELVKDITENKTKAKEPLLAISPTMSLFACNSAARSAFWR